MSPDPRCARRASAAAFAVVALLTFPFPSSSQDLPWEIRFHAPGSAFRWSSEIPDDATLSYDDQFAERSLYVSPGIGVRLYPRGGHGVLAEVDNRGDLDLDGLFDEGGDAPVAFFLVRGGYAHRSVWAGRLRPERRAHAVTLSASAVAGYARSTTGDTALPRYGAVVGPSLSLEYDLHVGRYFFGWSIAGDLLVHARGPMRLSGFLSWNYLPCLRIGATFGPPVQAPRAPRPEDERAKAREATDPAAGPGDEARDGP